MRARSEHCRERLETVEWGRREFTWPHGGACCCHVRKARLVPNLHCRGDYSVGVDIYPKVSHVNRQVTARVCPDSLKISSRNVAKLVDPDAKVA